MAFDPNKNPLDLHELQAGQAGWDATVQANAEALAPQDTLHAGNAVVALGNANGEFEAVTPLQLPSSTVAGLPSASPAGRMVYVTDESGGAVVAFADGADWRRLTDRAVVS